MGTKLFEWLFNRYMENVKNKYEKEMEALKRGYEVELTKIKAELDDLVFISKMQYEKEYKVYQELWSLQVDCIDKYYDCANRILMITDVRKQNIQVECLGNISDQIRYLVNEFETRSLKYKPFIDNNIYMKLRDISKHAVSIMASIDNTLAVWQNDIRLEAKIEKLKDIVQTEIGMISDAREETSNLIRKYLSDLRIKHSAN